MSEVLSATVCFNPDWTQCFLPIFVFLIFVFRKSAPKQTTR